MGRPKQHDESMGIALLDEAEQQLAAGGPDAVSLRGVAQAVGTTTRAVYSVFGGKDGLLAALAVRGYGMLEERVRAIPTTANPASDLINVGAVAFRSFALDAPHLFRLTFERVPATVFNRPEVKTAATTSGQSLAARVTRTQEAGQIDARPTREVIFVFHALCQGMASCELSREPPPIGAGFWRVLESTDLAQLWREALTALVTGLAPIDRPETQ